MSRIIFFGDLHANWEAWLALQQAERVPEALFCLGDTVGYGPDPKRCLDSVQVHATAIIGGRHDTAVAADEIASPIDLLAETWSHAQSVLTKKDLCFLAALPTSLSITLDGVRFYLGRLSPDDLGVETYSLITAPVAWLRKQLAQIKADVILLGGPHIPAMRQVDGRLIVCPGSMGLPRYGVADPTFAAWEDGRMQIHHLHYHPHMVAQKMGLLPLAPEHIEQLQDTLTNGWG